MIRPKINCWFISVFIAFCCLNIDVHCSSLPCKPYTSKTYPQILEDTRKSSLLNNNKYSINVFANKIDNFDLFKTFGKQINSYFSKVIEFTFYCKEDSDSYKENFAEVVSVKNGMVFQQQNITVVNPQFIKEFMKKFEISRKINVRTDRIKTNLLDTEISARGYIRSRKDFRNKIRYLEELTLAKNNNTSRKLKNMTLTKKNSNNTKRSDIPVKKLALREISVEFENIFSHIDKLSQELFHDPDEEGDNLDATSYPHIHAHSHLKKENKTDVQGGKLSYKLQFTQFHNRYLKTSDYISDIINFAQFDMSNKSLRIFIICFITALSLGLSLLMVKFSIDMATTYKTENNKLKEQKMRNIIETNSIMQKYLHNN